MPFSALLESFSARHAGALALAFLAPLFLSWLACLGVMKRAPKIGLLDRPGERKIHKSPIPTGGGIGIWLGVMIPLAAISILALGYDSTPEGATIFGKSADWLPGLLADHLGGIALRLGQLWTLLGLGTALVILGSLDDRFNLPWKLRLGAEFLIAIIAVSQGFRATFFLDAPWITCPVSVLWIVGLINSFNMLDNMDALSGGVATICSLFLAAITLCFAPNPTSGEPQYFLCFFMVILAGSISGFLVLNRPPARMFMGDGGAYFIGFLLAVSTLATTWVGGESTPKSAVFVPVVALAVPLYDTISVVIIRLRNGASPFVGDNNHYSHRLVALGLSKPQAVATIWLTTAICATGAFYLYQVSFVCAVMVLLQTGFILALVAILEFAARKKIRSEEEQLRLLAEEREKSGQEPKV